MTQHLATASGVRFRKMRVTLSDVLTYVVLGLWTIVCLFPLYWVAVTSLKGEPEIMQGPFFLPFVDFTPSSIAWRYILDSVNDQLPMRFFNSTLIGLASTVLTVLIGGLAVYGLTRFRYAVAWMGFLLILLAVALASCAFVVSAVGLQVFFAAVAGFLLLMAAGFKDHGPALHNGGILVAMLATRILPPVVVVLPIYFMAQHMGLLDTRFVLILTYTASNLPIAVWLLVPVFGKTATDQEEAAQLDGASHIEIFFTILLPMVAASVSAVGLLVFILCWNEYLFAAYLSSTSTMTLPPWVMGQMSIKEAQVGGDGQEWAQLSAAIIFMVVPVLACIALAQRFLRRTIQWGRLL